jgi:hypothetical protein
MQRHKTTLLILFTIFLVALVFWFASKNPVATPTIQTAVTESGAQAPAPAPTPLSTSAATRAVATAPSPTQSPPGSQLGQQLAQEKQKLDTIRQRLQSQQRQQAQQIRQANQVRMSKISQDSEKIQDLMDIIQEDRQTENELNEAAANALRDQNSAAQVARDQIDENIQTQMQEIQRTQDQLYSMQFTGYIESEDETQFGSLQDLLQAQQQELALLRAQRVAISASVLNQSRAITNSTDQQKAAVVSDEESIQSQIESLRNEILQIQNQRGQSASAP